MYVGYYLVLNVFESYCLANHLNGNEKELGLIFGKITLWSLTDIVYETSKCCHSQLDFVRKIKAMTEKHRVD